MHYCHVCHCRTRSAGCWVRDSVTPFASDLLGNLSWEKASCSGWREGQSLPLGWRAAAGVCPPFHLCSASEVASVHVPLAFPGGGPGHCQGTAHPPCQHSCGGSVWCKRVYVRTETVPLLSSCDPHGVCLCPMSEGSWRLALQSRYVLCPALPPPPAAGIYTHTATASF